MRIFLLYLTLTISGFAAFSQEIKSVEDKEAAYTKTINTRAEKIVATLGISDAAKTMRLTKIIADQYRALNGIHNDRDELAKKIKENNEAKEITELELKKLDDRTTEKLNALHQTYLSTLSKELNEAQVIQVKDGMTYNVLPITYKAFLEMIPTLKDTEKAQIMTWLVEAREHAMDAESSEKKHGWFGKYKGRINNYLSNEGYDLKKEGDEWKKRMDASKR